MNAALLVALALLAGPRAAELTAYPNEPGLAVGVVRSSEPGGWLVFQPQPFLPIAADIADDQQSIVFQAPPGSYVVLFFPPGKLIQPQVVPIELGGEPGPGPRPDPPDPPPPAAPVAWLVVIEESKDRTADAGDVLTSREVREYCKANNVRLWFKDQHTTDEAGQPLPTLAKYLAELDGIPLPAVLLVSDSGDILHKGRLPATAAELLDLIENQ